MDDTTCITARGGVYDASKSTSQQALGAYRLGMEYLGLGGNGDYTMETIAALDNTQGEQIPLAEQLVAGINDTDYYVGYFGLGVNDSPLNGVVANGPVAVLANQTTIGSQSYGYTAGAYYGGWDENRLVDHDTIFNLNTSTKQPEVMITSITTSVSDAAKTPASWPAASVSLTSDGESTTALIDSSTPFLWLPTSICDRFAVAFNITWNETFGLYVFPDGDSLEQFRAAPDLSVAFVLSSTGSTDDSAESPDGQATVTITVSANAFVQYAQPPFMGLSPGTPAVPYFPLRRVNDGGRIIIGRTFLQEAYLIVDYEASTFSVHQAAFPDDPLTNTLIKAIPSFNNGKGKMDGPRRSGLSREQLAGVVVGASIAAMILVMVVWWWLRKRKDQERNTEAEGTFKDADSLEQPGTPTTGSGDFLSKISKNLTWSKPGGQDARGQSSSSAYPAKYRTDPNSEHYWTAGPLPPVELGARRVTSTNGAAEFRTSNGDDMAAYEIARMGLDPLPLDINYDTSSSTQEQQFYGTQQYMDPTAAAPRRPSTDLGLYNLFPASPTPDDFSEGSSSPMSPYGDHRSEWNAHNMERYPSTRPLVNTQHHTVRSNSTMSSTGEPHSVLRSVSSHGTLVPSAPAPAVQREPIDPSNVICLGPLPNNIRLPYPSSSTPHPPPPPPTHHPYRDDFFDPPPIPPSVNFRRNRVSTAETLGSNYTVEEEARGRINGEDIVHIPHLPDRRYSWEN